MLMFILTQGERDYGIGDEVTAASQSSCDQEVFSFFKFGTTTKLVSILRHTLGMQYHQEL